MYAALGSLDVGCVHGFLLIVTLWAQAKDTTAQKAGEAKDYTGAKTQDAKQAAGSTADDLSKKAGQTKDAAAQKAGEVRHLDHVLAASLTPLIITGSVVVWLATSSSLLSHQEIQPQV